MRGPRRAPRRIDEPFPTGIDDLEGDWLSRALGLPDAKDHRVAAVRIGEERGHMGSAYRLSFTCEHSSHPAESVVVKLPAPEGEARETADRGGLYVREFRFFDELAHRSDVRAPRCLAAGYAEGRGFALVLEDLGSAREIDQVVGCDLAHSKIVLSELAAFHASWWGKAALADMTWATRHTDRHRVENLTRLLHTGWPRLCDALGDELPPQARRVGLDAADALGEAFGMLAAEPPTLLHGDVRLDNLLFEDSAGKTSVVLLDWQSLSTGAGALDVSYFLAQNIRTDDLEQHGPELLQHYQGTLAAHGVEYSMDDLTRSVALAMPLTFAVASSLYVLADPGEERTRHLALAMAARAVAAAERLGHPATVLAGSS